MENINAATWWGKDPTLQFCVVCRISYIVCRDASVEADCVGGYFNLFVFVFTFAGELCKLFHQGESLGNIFFGKLKELCGGFGF